MSKVLFVASNPSNVTGINATIKNFYKWLDVLEIRICCFANVSDYKTPGNRPLKKSEWELEKLSKYCKNHDKIVALGATARDALERLSVRHFSLPHPSPRNRQLNDKYWLNNRLRECKEYVNEHSLFFDRSIQKCTIPRRHLDEKDVVREFPDASSSVEVTLSSGSVYATYTGE